MELNRKVRLACREGMSERAAARHFGVSRESVRKMLEFSVPPGYRRTAPVRRPKLDGFTGFIDEWLRRDRDDDHRKQEHTAKRIFERLRNVHGFIGGWPGPLLEPAPTATLLVIAHEAWHARNLPLQCPRHTRDKGQWQLPSVTLSYCRNTPGTALSVDKDCDTLQIAS